MSIVETACPECGHPWRKGETEMHPEAGDVTICNGCGAVLRFWKPLTSSVLGLRRLSRRDERTLRRLVRERLNDLQPN